MRMRSIFGLKVDLPFHNMFVLFYAFIICLTNMKNQIYIFLIMVPSLHLKAIFLM